MTHDVIERECQTLKTLPLEPNVRRVFLEIDITSLDDAGLETSFDATAYCPDNVEEVEVVGQENPQYNFTYNRAANELHVYDADTNGTINAGTDVGMIDLLVTGLEFTQ